MMTTIMVLAMLGIVVVIANIKMLGVIVMRYLVLILRWNINMRRIRHYSGRKIEDKQNKEKQILKVHLCGLDNTTLENSTIL